MHLFGWAIEQSTATTAKHGVSAKQEAVDDERHVSVDMSLREPDRAGHVADPEPGTLTHLLGDAGDFAVALGRTNHTHLPKQMPFLKVPVDANVIGVCVGVDDRAESDLLGLAIVQNRLCFRPINGRGFPSLGANNQPYQVVLGRWNLVNLEGTRCAQERGGGSCDNVGHGWLGSGVRTIDADFV